MGRRTSLDDMAKRCGGKQFLLETENSYFGKVVYVRVLMLMYVEYVTVAVIVKL
jgi:hypothetical protein